jgi:hypothetical protein
VKRKYMLFIALAALIAMIFPTVWALTTADLLRAEGSKNAAPILSYANSGAANQPPTAKSLTPDVEYPQTAGATIVWTGTAYDPEGNKLLYQFWLNGPSTGNTWKPMTNWSEGSVWSWTTSPIDSGNNIIDMRVRDSHHAGPWDCDSHISADYVIDNIAGAEGSSRANGRPAILEVRSDRQSPQDQGINVAWTTTASDPDKDTILYQYWLKGPSTEQQWLPVTQWTTGNSWTWDTAQAKAGIYTIEVRVRDGYHADIESSDDSKRTIYVLRQKGIIK